MIITRNWNDLFKYLIKYIVLKIIELATIDDVAV